MPDSVHLYGGELLFAWSGTPGTSFGAHIWQQREAVLNQHIFKLVFDEHLFDKRFLKLSLNHLVESLIAKAHGGVGLAHITRKVFDEILIPIPPFNEQRRIVDQYEQMSSLCEIVDKSYSDLHALSAILKARILDLAIRGELDTQDPEDEPASALLFRIRAATDKPPCTKREKNRRTGSVDVAAPPFSIPKSWEWTTIGAICDVIMGQSPEGTFVSSSCNGIEFHQGKIFFGNKYLLFSDKTTVSPTKVVDPGTILLCVRAPVGKVNITSRRICIGRGLCGIRSSAMIDNDYLYLLLQSYEEVFNSNAIGSTFKAISCDVIRKQPVPLPPLDEQRRIVAKVEELFAAIDQALG